MDTSAILYLSQMEKNHTNVYRFTMTLTESVCPEMLQKAADRVHARFPTILAGFRPGCFSHCVVPAPRAPRVREDPGLLKSMPQEELHSCACRLMYSGCRLSLEAFHGLTDGFGAMSYFRTLTAEYLYLRYGADTPEREKMLEAGMPDWEAELRDSYRDYADARPARPRNRHAYQVAAGDRDWRIKPTVELFSTEKLLRVSRRFGVSMTTLLSCIMAETIMELQSRKNAPGKKLPVRIMVPIDLRRQFPSKTMRNFILYALPTMEWEDRKRPLRERLAMFQDQLRTQTAREPLAAQIAANVSARRSLLFRMIPMKLKLAVMRLAYSFFGECNSSITLTNLGSAALSEQMQTYVKGLDVLLTPRRKSPYNCGVISLGDVTSISITRFGRSPELEELFFGKLRSVLAQ